MEGLRSMSKKVKENLYTIIFSHPFQGIRTEENVIAKDDTEIMEKAQNYCMTNGNENWHPTRIFKTGVEI